MVLASVIGINRGCVCFVVETDVFIAEPVVRNRISFPVNPLGAWVLLVDDDGEPRNVSGPIVHGNGIRDGLSFFAGQFLGLDCRVGRKEAIDGNARFRISSLNGIGRKTSDDILVEIEHGTIFISLASDGEIRLFVNDMANEFRGDAGRSLHVDYDGLAALFRKFVVLVHLVVGRYHAAGGLASNPHDIASVEIDAGVVFLPTFHRRRKRSHSVSI